MNGPGDISSGSGDRGKRGDMLRGILKIRRKRNKSVSKTSSRDRSSLRQIVASSPRLTGSTCPTCHVSYDRGNKRRLVDSCGHERCFSCIGRNEKCALCSQMAGGLADLSPKQATPASLSTKIRQSLMMTSSTSSTLERARVDKTKVASTSSTLEERRNTPAANSPVTTMERFKRSRFDSLLNISAAAASTPENSLPRRRKEVRREERRGSEDTTSSHASLVSSSVNRFYSGPQLSSDHDLPRPLYFEVPQPVPAPLIGRGWVWHEVRETLTSQLPTNKGILISGGPGAGKTAIILTLVQRSCFGQPQEDSGLTEPSSASGDTMSLLASQVVAYHFCQADNAPTCSVPVFVRSLAAQLAQAPALAPGYPSLLTSDPGLLSLLSPAACARDPGLALRVAILAPLASLEIPASGVMIILVDGLCEAEHHRPDYGHTLASFLASHSEHFPAWLKIVATARSSGMEAARSLPFHKLSLDTSEDERTRKDLSDYITTRINVAPNSQTPRINRNLVTKFSNFLISKARGCFLYVKLILDLVEKGNLTVKSGSFKVVPQNLAEIYQLAFNLKFSSSESFVHVADLLSICLASLQPISLHQLYSAHSALFITPELTWKQFREQYQTIADILVLRRDATLMCFHPTIRDWLLRRRLEEGDKFLCDIRTGHTALALHLGRQPPLSDIRGRGEKILEMSHHVLKSALYKNCPGQIPGRVFSSPRQLAACFTALSAEDISAALACPRNIYSPIVKVSRLLLLAGADPSTRVGDEQDGSVLGVHCSLGHTDLVSLLLEYGAQAGPEEVRAAVAGGHSSILQLLAQCGAEVTQAGILAEAAASGRVNILEYLLAQEWNNDSLEDAAGLALTKAIQGGKSQIFDLLIDVKDINLGIEDTESGLNCLGAAAKVDNLEVAQILLKKEESNLNLETALLQAAEAGHEAVMDLLLSHGADLGVRNDRGQSLIHLAASRGHCAILRRLLEVTSDDLGMMEADSEGLSPLTSAILGDQTEAAAVLLGHCGPGILEAVDTSGRSALDIAIYQGSPGMVELLLDSGANMERVDRRGIKPLDRVIGHGSSSIVSVFLRKGAKLGSATWAMASGKPDIQLILLNKLMEDGNTLYRQNKFSDAAHRYKYALKRLGAIQNSDWSESGMPASDWPAEMETNLLLNLSRVERRLGRFETAVSLASRVLDSRPSCAAALVTRAKAARSLGLTREAFVDFNTALELMPGNRELRRVILRMKEGLRNDMTASFMSCCSHESIRFIDDGSAVEMET